MSGISLHDIYDKNLNFIIGSGASFGLFPTLKLDIKDDGGNEKTIEELATLFSGQLDSPLYTLLFMHYYSSCIKPVLDFNIEEALKDDASRRVIENYQEFITTVLGILSRKKRYDRSCNIFTTNYDSCIADSADRMLQEGKIDFIINDGARGFAKRTLQAKNFNSFVCQTGVFQRHHEDIPQINLIHLHGSVHWYKKEESIQVDYASDTSKRALSNDVEDKLVGFSDKMADETSKISDLPKNEVNAEESSAFWKEYNELPIVNPTKWKFHETVFEEHYYQMLRHLSYELEKPNSIFITFGFSFADEHIRNLVKRSLSNPSLQLFICCFDEKEKETMEAFFKDSNNVEYIIVDGFLDFTTFNEKVFTLASKAEGDSEEVTVGGDLEANEE